MPDKATAFNIGIPCERHFKAQLLHSLATSLQTAWESYGRRLDVPTHVGDLDGNQAGDLSLGQHRLMLPSTERASQDETFLRLLLSLSL